MPQMTTTPNKVKIRMYRQGLGDCFLLAFPRDNEPDKPVYMLIDCGLFYRTPNEANIMTDVATSIKEATNAHIDIVVVTHEHYDHLSGFRHKTARKVWDTIQIDRVWAAWTEDPDNPVAKTLKGSRALQEAALHVAVHRLQAAGNSAAADHITNILGFSSGVRKDLEYILGRVNTPRFLSPGDKPLAIPGSSKFRCFVLGPPDDDIKLLKRSNPSSQNSEVYEPTHFGSGLPLTGENVIASSILATANNKELNRLKAAGQDIPQFDQISADSLPFDPKHCISMKEARKAKNSFFSKHYGLSPKGKHQEAWRKIDGDWLGAAETLAMQLDGAVNNTSLALAFQFKAGQEVMLFPGDAQVGNILSWHTRSWKVDDKKLTTQDLLNKTVLYKVGHHGSHNATLKKHGLEMMTSRKLTALIPVSKAMAAKKGKKINGKPVGWKMPFKPLLDALNEKTKYRVIQSDDGFPTSKPPKMNTSTWKTFKRRGRNTSLYVEIEVG